MTLKLVEFPPATPAPEEVSVAEMLARMAERVEGAKGIVLVADMGTGSPLQILVAGQEYVTAADALFLLALGQRRILEASEGADADA